VRVAPYRLKNVAVVSTLLPGLKPSVVTKTLGVLEKRLEPAGAAIVAETRTPHDPAALRLELEGLSRSSAELLVVFGASAIADRRDVIPRAIEEAGGRSRAFRDAGRSRQSPSPRVAGRQAVIGAPGCARSPKENGFDWILHRLLAGLPVTRADITGLGVGGLLMEIVSRPQPRAGAPGEEPAEAE
jgi:molybdenum cofactor cytidylyltransferase